MSASAFSAVAAAGVAVAPTPEEARRLARAAELGEVLEVLPGALRPFGSDVWTFRPGRVSLTCRGTVTGLLFDREDLRRLVGVVAERLEVRP